MEIEAILQKPYTERQKLNFIVTNNHNLGYEIRETSLALEAWGYTEEEKQEQEKQRRNSEIDSKIKELQLMSLNDVLQGNKENIKLYNEVIASLEEGRPE
jgi:DNA-binding transcriptional MerR regulator